MVTPNSAEFWPGRRGAVVDGHQRGDLGRDDRRGADADFLGDGEQPVDVDGRLALGALEGLDGGQHHGDAGLVVEMARVDEAVLEKLRLRVDGDDVADLDAVHVGFGGGCVVTTSSRSST